MATRYSIADLVAQANTTLPDNATQDISAADVRDMVKNFLATMKPSVASIVRDTSLVLALSAAPVVVKPWNTVRATDPPEMVPNLTDGSIAHAISSLGNANAMTRVTFYIGVSGTAGAELTFQLYANGVATGFLSRISTSGAGNVVNAILAGLVPANTDTTYDVRVQSSNTANYTFTNGLLRLENVPVAV